MAVGAEVLAQVPPTIRPTRPAIVGAVGSWRLATVWSPENRVRRSWSRSRSARAPSVSAAARGVRSIAWASSLSRVSTSPNAWPAPSAAR